MKTLTIILALLLSGSALAQIGRKDNTLDLNYTASYKNSLSFKWSSRLAESQDWKLQGFTAGGAYNLNASRNRFSLLYDVWRAPGFNAPIASKYGLAYSAQSNFTSLNLTLYQTTNSAQQNGFSGRIDLNMKFGG